ncbi:hypothetical protein HETIRDRAFT_449540 [Heterobasidion irregulare TC 32-1]|uniref:Uncharacterized protein n=1 Tax=Heterobasidion irregulare (strain TC 32-1) TaxID=747525 RepID=W4KDW1_HETIT|nr:uncharacterized protein HETIRDRAFT_449540 [Heterobasidion irregulare TC 32-1]ETW83934.1 hypothetical protein HETIRDRAFT_449540 [Heterobasidion irregulare TC 32-1]
MTRIRPRNGTRPASRRQLYRRAIPAPSSTLEAATAHRRAGLLGKAVQSALVRLQIPEAEADRCAACDDDDGRRLRDFAIKAERGSGLV